VAAAIQIPASAEGYNCLYLMRVTAFLLLALTLGPAARSAVASPKAARPATNVVVITIDTLRADHLGCYGYKQIRTPNIDALAAAGVRFERAYTPVPITLPSHTVIFTGTYPTFSGMHDFSANRLGPSQATLASILKEHGYATGAVVASAVLDSRFGLDRGFDFYYDHFEFNRLQEANLDEMERPGNLVADQVLGWLGKNSNAPFFLWMHLYDPHFPYRPPAPYSEEYKSHPYDGEIAFADEQVGRVIRFLKDGHLLQNTLVVLSGDHGEGLGEHGEQTHGFFIYNSTLHVPLIFRLPGEGTGKTAPEPVSLADILPTVLQVLNIPVPAEVQGQSLTPILAGTSPTQPRSLYSETFLPRLHFNWSELRGIEMERYHFIDAPKPELYDLTKDPNELENLYSQKNAVATELRTKLTAMIREYTPGTELAEKTGLDPALMERLKSLGYAGFSGGGDPKVKSADLPDPKDRIQVYELISEGMAASQHGQYQESIEKLNAALATEPNSVSVHYLLGLDYYRIQDFAKAIDHLQAVIARSPDYALAVYQLGLCYAKAGNMPDAILNLKRALQLDGTNFSAAYNLGAAYMHEGKATDAASALRQALTISPDYVAARTALGEVLLYQGQTDEALEQLRRAVATAPGDARAHASLAKVLEAKGLHDEARDEMQKAQEAARAKP
jgi:arylsulfatase A-like enzyme/cytochrome c-type biogenesis protein CcmH/NrfG